MSIYTRTGDEGMTSLRGDQPRVTKSHWQIEIVGALDEVSSHIGVVRAMLHSWRSCVNAEVLIQLESYDGYLKSIQSDLFVLGSLVVQKTDTHGGNVAATFARDNEKRISMAQSVGMHQQQVQKFDERVFLLEEWIDLMEQELPELKNFIFSGGTVLSAHLMLSRSVARRGERQMVRWIEFQSRGVRRSGSSSDQAWIGVYWHSVMAYLNRLSDFLFVLSRHVNKTFVVTEEIWEMR